MSLTLKDTSTASTNSIETRWPAATGDAKSNSASRTRDAMTRGDEHNRAQLGREVPGMRRIALEIAVALLLTIGAVLSLAVGAMASDVMVMDAYARASATPAAKGGAVYLTIMNHGNEPDRLIGITSEIARAAQIHETTEENGVASMQPVDELEIAAHGEQALAPGGLHVMLFGLRKPLKEGSHFKITLQFERNGNVVVDVPVGGVAADSADHAGHAMDTGN